MDASLLSILDSSLDPSSSFFVEAQRKLQIAKETNLPEFIRALSEVIANPEASLGARHLAGILLKNCFEFKTEEEKMNFYKNTSSETLYYIKLRMVNVMKTVNESQAVMAACTAVARIAQIELSTKTWPEFFDVIIAMVESNDVLQTRSSLICLSFLIEDLSTLYENQNVNLLTTPEINRLLTSVIKGVYLEDPQSCRMALRCLQNLLFFVATNMEVDAERDVIVEAICRRCSANNDVDTRTAAYDCLVQLVSEYYARVIPCLQIIVPFLWQAIDSQLEQIAIPALEFWNTICEIEIQMARPGGTDRTAASAETPNGLEGGIIRQVIPYLLPKILFTMTLHKFEDMDTDTWTLPMAAGVCLSLCTQTVKNDIVHLVLSFVTENFTNPEWNRREAAVLAYGYIMEGPDTETLRCLVTDSFGNLCDVLVDSSIAVRDTTAWTIARIATFHCSVVVNHLGSPDVPNSNLSKIVRALFDVPRVAVNICYFIHELADHINGRRHSRADESLDTNLLDCMFTRLCEMLVNRSLMEDSLERNLYVSIYSSLCALIAGVSNNCLTELNALLDHFVVMAANMIKADAFNYESRLKIQAMCGAIQVLVSRLGRVNNLNLLMTSLFEFLYVELDEDALLTLGAVVNVVELPLLAPYVPKVAELVLSGLQSEAHGVCKICIELTSDISRALEAGFEPYLDRFMMIFIKILQDVNSERALKPPIVTSIGDIAMAVGGKFATYVQSTMTLLLQAAGTSYDMGPIDNEEWIQFVNQLQEASLQAFTGRRRARAGIVYGLKEGHSLELMRPYVNYVLEFTQHVIDMPPPYFDTNLYKLAVALIG